MRPDVPVEAPVTTIGLIADVHLRAGLADRLERELAGVRDRIAAAEPDHCVVLGDLIEDGDDPATDAAHVERVRSVLDDFDCPVTYLLGNHDVEQLSVERLGALLGQDRFYGVRQVGDVPLVALNSAWPAADGAPGWLGPAQRDWLADRAAAGDLRDALVVVHHPVGAFDLSENVWFRDYPERAYCVDRKSALAALADADVRGTVSGHVHQAGRDDFHGVDHVSLNAFSKETPEKPFTGTYGLVECSAATTTVTERVDGEVRHRHELN